MELVRTAHGVAVLNDAYNSSPTAADAALRALAAMTVDGRRVAVLGEMLELGDHADEEHEALGRLAAALGLDAVLAVGDHADAIVRGAGTTVAARALPDAAAAAEVVLGEARSGDAVLVKASRAIGLEVVVDALVVGPAAAGSNRR
jgi:UDP-N-acetylmuramoyl-tripeptide--D-alanyl-D-alanine ligase